MAGLVAGLKQKMQLTKLRKNLRVRIAPIQLLAVDKNSQSTMADSV